MKLLRSYVAHASAKQLHRAFQAWESGKYRTITEFSGKEVIAQTKLMRKVHVGAMLLKPHRCEQLLKKVADARTVIKVRDAATARAASTTTTMGAAPQDSDDEEPIVDRSSPPPASDDEGAEKGHDRHESYAHEDAPSGTDTNGSTHNAANSDGGMDPAADAGTDDDAEAGHDDVPTAAGSDDDADHNQDGTGHDNGSSTGASDDGNDSDGIDDDDGGGIASADDLDAGLGDDHAAGSDAESD
jgi:hypothetical protein